MEDFKVFINFKTYPQGTGERAVELARILRQVNTECNRSAQDKFASVEIIPVVQIADVFKVKQEIDIPVWVQHLDWQEQGEFTGWVNLEAVVEAGASGTLLNHSEHQIPPGTIKQTLKRVRNLGGVRGMRENFEVMVCCRTLGQMERLGKLKPDYLGYEISGLIGGETSVVDSEPKAIEHAVEICGVIPLIVGAGINKKEDLQKTRQLGAKGVLISSAVMLAENPKAKLTELLSLLKEV